MRRDATSKQCHALHMKFFVALRLTLREARRLFYSERLYWFRKSFQLCLFCFCNLYFLFYLNNKTLALVSISLRPVFAVVSDTCHCFCFLSPYYHVSHILKLGYVRATYRHVQTMTCKRTILPLIYIMHVGIKVLITYAEIYGFISRVKYLFDFLLQRSVIVFCFKLSFN